MDLLTQLFPNLDSVILYACYTRNNNNVESTIDSVLRNVELANDQKLAQTLVENEAESQHSLFSIANSRLTQKRCQDCVSSHKAQHSESTFRLHWPRIDSVFRNRAPRLNPQFTMQINTPDECSTVHKMNSDLTVQLLHTPPSHSDRI